MLLINRDGLDVDLPLLDAAVNELRNARFSPHWPKVSASPSSTTRWRNRKRASFLIYCALSQRDDDEDGESAGCRGRSGERSAGSNDELQDRVRTLRAARGVIASEKAVDNSNHPTNHNPQFAPVIHPTLETGVEALRVGAHAWLSRKAP